MKRLFRNTTLLLTALTSGSLISQTAPAPADSPSRRPAGDVVEMSPFVISSAASSSMQIEETTAGTLVARPLQRMPMAINVVGAEFLKEMGILNADGLASLLTGVANQTETTTMGTGDNTFYTVRGFNSLPRRNGFAPGGRLFDMTGVDRVEIIKGPNSLLYGQSAPGGLINYVTKRPRLRWQTGAQGAGGVAFGSFDFHRGQLDVDASIIPGKLGVRLPASYTSNRREFDFYENEVHSYNPSALWRIFPRTELLFEYEWLRVDTNRAAFTPTIWTPPGGTEIVDKTRRGLGRRANILGPYTDARNLQKNWTADLTTRLTDHLTFRAVYSDNARDRKDSAIVNGDPFRVVPLGYQGQFVVDGNRIEGWKADLLGEYEIGRFQTRTILGYEYNENDFFANTWQTWRNGVADRIMTIDLGFNPATGRVSRKPSASDFVPIRNNLLDPNFWRRTGGTLARSEWTNLRLSEVLSAFEDRLQILGGVARGESKNINLQNGVVLSQEKDTYQAGLGYVLNARHMVFVNKSTSYQPQFLIDVNYDPLPAQLGIGEELGLKSTWGKTGLTTTVTLFQQERTNVGRQYNDFELQRTYGVLTPGEEAKGFELELTWRASKQIIVQGSYTQFDGKLTGVNQGQEYKLGRELPRSPEKSAMLTAFYTFDQGALHGLKLGLGGNYRSATELDVNLPVSRARRSDARTVFWLSANKNFKLSDKRSIAVRLNVGNLFDKEFITESQSYGDPRTIRLATEMKF